MKVVVGLVLVVLGTLLPPTLAQSSGKIHLRMVCKSCKRYSRLSLKVPLVGGLIHSIPTSSPCYIPCSYLIHIEDVCGTTMTVCACECVCISRPADYLEWIELSNAVRLPESDDGTTGPITIPTPGFPFWDSVQTQLYVCNIIFFYSYPLCLCLCVRKRWHGLLSSLDLYSYPLCLCLCVRKRWHGLLSSLDLYSYPLCLCLCAPDWDKRTAIIWNWLQQLLQPAVPW